MIIQHTGNKIELDQESQSLHFVWINDVAGNALHFFISQLKLQCLGDISVSLLILLPGDVKTLLSRPLRCIWVPGDASASLPILLPGDAPGKQQVTAPIVRSLPPAGQACFPGPASGRTSLGCCGHLEQWMSRWNIKDIFKSVHLCVFHITLKIFKN